MRRHGSGGRRWGPEMAAAWRGLASAAGPLVAPGAMLVVCSILCDAATGEEKDRSWRYIAVVCQVP